MKNKHLILSMLFVIALLFATLLILQAQPQNDNVFGPIYATYERIMNVDVQDQKLYFVGYENERKHLSCYNLDTQTLVPKLYILNDNERIVDYATTNSGSLTILKYRINVDNMLTVDNTSNKEEYFLVELDQNGNLLNEINLSNYISLEKSLGYISIEYDLNNDIYILDYNNTIWIMDKELNILKEHDYDMDICLELLKSNDEVLTVTTPDLFNYHINVLNRSTGNDVRSHLENMKNVRIFKNVEGNLVYAKNNKLYKYDLTYQTEMELYYFDIAIPSGSINNIIPLTDDTYIIVYSQLNETTGEMSYNSYHVN